MMRALLVLSFISTLFIQNNFYSHLPHKSIVADHFETHISSYFVETESEESEESEVELNDFTATQPFLFTFLTTTPPKILWLNEDHFLFKNQSLILHYSDSSPPSFS